MSAQIRENSINNIFNRYENDPLHARQVKKLALIMFDRTRGVLHKLSDNDRDLLWAASLLHDIGYYISAKGHNKHAYKLITEARPEGFSALETEIIGNVARYHRGKLPKKKHSAYINLPLDARKTVNALAAFLRLADGLDRTHRCIIKGVNPEFDSYTRDLSLQLEAVTPDCSCEIRKAEEKKDLFEREFSVNIRLMLCKSARPPMRNQP